MTTNINALNWGRAPEHLNLGFNAYVADLGNDRFAIVSYCEGLGESSLAISEPATGRYFDSSETQDWVALDQEFKRKSWCSFVDAHEQKSRELLDAEFSDYEDYSDGW